MEAMIAFMANSQPSGAPTGPVPLLDVNAGNAPLREQFLSAIAEVVDSGRFLHGPQVTELEAIVAELCETKHAVGCASGSDALLLALMAHEVGAGDEVILPSFTFFATASAVTRVGAKPVFVDIDPVTFNLNPTNVAEAVTENTKAIIPVHLFGRCADMTALNELAEKHNLIVIEDAAQAIGAKHHDQPAGTMGDAGCFSFYPTKNLGGFGDGGMITTNSDQVAKNLRVLCNHGMEPRYYHSKIGVNSRLDTIQAAVLGVKIAQLSQWTSARIKNAAYYLERFADADLNDMVELPSADDDGLAVWNQFTIRVKQGGRDALQAALAAEQIGSAIYYPVPLHMQECFADMGCEKGMLPHTEQASLEVLSLPIYPELEEWQLDRVVDGVVSATRQKRQAA